MILRGCKSGLVILGAGSRCSNQCLTRFGVSYRTHFSSRVSTRPNMDALPCRKNKKKTDYHLFLLVAIPTVCGVITSSILRHPDLLQVKYEAFGKISLGLTVVILYGCLQGVIIQELWPVAEGFITKKQISRPEIL